MRMLFNNQTAQQVLQQHFSFLLELSKRMINSCQSLLCHLTPHITNKHQIVDAQLVRKLIFNDSYFLGG